MKVTAKGGYAEVFDSNDYCITRICGNAIAADLKDFDVIVVRRDNSLNLYDVITNFYRELKEKTTEKDFSDFGLLVTKKEGDLRVYTYNK